MKNKTFAALVLIGAAVLDLLIPFVPLLGIVAVIACFSSDLRHFITDLLDARDEE